ncbi:response regulator [candidate division WOR-3 bacterium]|nr:response regulator [candidate division WOR-3 bacterium]
MTDSARPRILLAEDEIDIALVARTRLEVNGFEVITAGDGETALARARESRPDLVLLDLKMPRLGGEEACRRLKADPELRDIPVIIFSASSSSQVVLEELRREVGAEDYIRKPYVADELLRKVCALLARRAPKVEVAT